MIAFDLLWFSTAVTFAAPSGPNASQRGGAVLDRNAAGTIVKAYVEPTSAQAVRSEAMQVPQGSQLYAVYTPSDPAVRVDSRADWDGLTCRVLARPARASLNGMQLWRTWCVDVS